MTDLRSTIEKRLGIDDARRLAKAVGGTRLHVPNDPRRSERLARIVGEELALKIVFHFGGSRLYVPTLAPPATIDARKLKRLVNRGWSSARIARALGCSERIVDAKRAKLRSRARQTTITSGDNG